MKKFDFSKVKVGDKLVRKMYGHRNAILESVSTVMAINSRVITCDVGVGGYTMEFRRDTGVQIFGKTYGWLELPEES